MGYASLYVLLVEAETHASLTLHTKNEDGTYSKRSFSTRPTIIPPNLLPHLFGQLVRTQPGCALLKRHCNVRAHIERIFENRCQSEEDVLLLKTSLYAVGHMLTTPIGVVLVKESLQSLPPRSGPELSSSSGAAAAHLEDIVQSIIEMVTFSDVYSVRATALNVLGLIGSATGGANVLYKLDWLCVRHDRNSVWPVHEPEDWLGQLLVTGTAANARGGHFQQQCETLDPLPYNYNALNDLETIPMEAASTTTTTGGGQDEIEGPGELVSLVGTMHSSKDPLKLLPLSSSCSSTEAAAAAAMSQAAPASSRLKAASVGTAGDRNSKQQHVRSLSESKTTDGIHLWTNYNSNTNNNINNNTTTISHSNSNHLPNINNNGNIPDLIANNNGLLLFWQRQRMNSGTDSNTSGVSSCDSTFGRNVIMR